jgi:cell fate (sporulation/competence/biofilm development) regulator YmcA (YheA/YmcA/DUF963 family)
VVEALGQSIEKVIQNADVATFETIQGLVEPLLQRDYQHIDKRQAVLGKIRGKVQELAKTRPATDPIFQELRVAMTKAKELLAIQ